ncbi:uncharacterized protein LOC130671215 isoform X3 [Microplitis mediator]|uniref:uncharacterized protein LOC130671215 isoform X3 n=1 Tax=Microplitis mediator TaxID=375433 RepID=UPI0025564C3D|nr:uncharacterized protein LOC130671215 isoform X3 [Microplitis mediator]
MIDIDNNFGMMGSSKMPHSHSTPAGVDGGSRTPPTTPRKAGKMLAVRVQMLDDKVTMFQVQAKALGRVLFDQVCKQLNLLEADYFGLEYQEPNGTKYWLDLEKPVCRQVGLTMVDPLLRFCVKFYTPDPGQLEEEFTRYLFCLQIKRDLAHGLLQCNDNTAALMASYIVQAECGDYVIEDYPDHTYLSTYKFVPHQDHELERRIMENHKKHSGQSPAEADLNLLETARRCELYGMKMHQAKDHEGVPLNLAVAHMGIVVFQGYTKINTFSWAKIRKISFKRKRFLIKLHPEGYGYYKDTVEFFFDGRNECKNFWKKCVENHGFFRCSVVKRVLRQKTRVLSRGSSFRYSGKTQKQIVEFVRDNYVKRQTFQRSNSFRQTSGCRALQGSEGGGYRGATPSSSLMGSSSISAHPLLPLGDPALGTPRLSLSCGSMTPDSPTTVTSVSMGGTSHHRRDDTAMSCRTLTSIDVHTPATPNQAPGRHITAQQRITSSTGRISPSNSSPPEFPPPRPLPRHPWQRSASCRELYATSFEDSGRARQPRNDKLEAGLADTFQLPSQGELDAPVTRYDESNRSYSAASSKLPSLDHDSVPERVYSSSYPGTSSVSTESGHEESGPGADLSHDDLSHDSYELLEREHEFEYPESYSSPHEDDDEQEALSDQSDEGIEHEMFQMDSETDSFVKHRSIKSTDKQLFKSVLADIKNVNKSKSTDRHSTLNKLDNNLIVTESRIQRSSTQIERKFEIKNNIGDSGKPPLPHQDTVRKDPVILQVQKQKLTVLNELKSLKPKYKITHVDSEVLRDEGIMRPKSRIDDDLSPVDGSKTILDQARERTTRARSIVSLEDQIHRPYIETGSLGRNHGNKKREETRSIEKLMAKERKNIEREERKRMERDVRRWDKSDRDRRSSMGRVDSRERRSMERLDFRETYSVRVERDDSRELRRSIERLDSIERNNGERFIIDTSINNKERNGKRNHRDSCRGKSVERLDSRELRKSMERIDSRESRRSPGKTHEYERHTWERIDSGNKSPFDHRHSSSRDVRGKSYERLDSRERERPTFDFDPRTIERLSSLEKTVLERFIPADSLDKSYDNGNGKKYSGSKTSADRRSFSRVDSRERRSLERLDSRERRRSIECLEPCSENSHRRRDTRDKKDELPRERDDWRSLERARKEAERLERERQIKVFMETRNDADLPLECEAKIKSSFTEYDPKVVGGVIVGFEETSLAGHIPVERTKSDPCPGRQRIGSNSKRHMLMHQKSIDLTPADSGDEDAFIAEAPRKNNDIPYTLHKRVMNGTVSEDKSESDSGKNSTKVTSKSIDLVKLPIKQVTDVSMLDLTKLPPTPNAITKLITDRPKSILISPDKTKSPKILSPKLSPTEPKIIHINTEKTPTGILKSPLKTMDKIKNEKIHKLSPTDPNVTIISVIDKKSKKSPADSGSERSPSKGQSLASIVCLEMKQVLEKKEVQKERLKVPDDSLEKQDSIEKIPLPEIPIRGGIIRSPTLERSPTKDKSPVRSPTKEKSPVKSPTKKSPTREVITVDIEPQPPATPTHRPTTPINIPPASPTRKPDASPKTSTATSPAKKPEKPKTLEKPSIPEKTKRILDRIESRFSEISKNSPTKVSRPKIIDTGFDDFVDPVADLPLDDVPVKPAFELETLKVPDFNPFMLRPHAEPLRSKSLSLAEEKAPIDTLLSPEVENKHFVQDVSPKKIKKAKSEPKKDFKKQSKSLEGDKPPLKKTGSKESRVSPATSKIDKSKLKLDMPQEIIIIDSTDVDVDVEPEISIVQKGRSKSVTRLTDRSLSKDEEPKKPRAKSASVDDELIKGIVVFKVDKARPKSLGISKSLSNTEKDSIDRVSPKKIMKGKSVDGKVSPIRRSPSRSPARSPDAKELPVLKDEGEEEAAAEEIEVKPDVDKDEDKLKLKLNDTAQDKLVVRESGPVLRRMDSIQSPAIQRRAKSLDTTAPLIPLNKLPPANAVSPKDDTVDDPDDKALDNDKKEIKPTAVEVSPNHRSDSTDPTPVPEIFTDSQSMTEPSTQYLESPLNEFQDITTCPDLIPYEQESGQVQQRQSQEVETVTTKIKPATRFIDQSSVESSAEPDIVQDNQIKPLSDVKKTKGEKKAESSSGTDSSEGEKKGIDRKMKTIGSSLSITTDEATPRGSIERDDVPNVTVSIVEGQMEMPIDYFDGDDAPHMVKSPIQISIEECSDVEEEPSASEEQNDELFDQAVFQAQQQEKQRLDSAGDTSEDTLDALDAQIQMQGPDSDVSSPDYADKMDEKTLVEVELTPEYLEMRKEDDEEAEELPEDEPPRMDSADLSNADLDNKKSRLSTERSRSEETITYTPDREDPDSSSCSIARPLGIGVLQPIVDHREIAMIKESRRELSLEDESSSGSQPGPRMEMSSTWKPFPLESSGSSSLEDAGWMPPDSDQHHQYPEGASGEDSFREDLADYPGALAYTIGPEILANYGAFALSRTLSRISERSTTSEQDKSDLEDSFKPSSRSPSLDDESLMSSDHQPSLSSDPPSGTALPSVSEDRRTSSELPDIPIDVPGNPDDDTKSPRTRRSRLQLQTSEDWPSPPSSPVFETPVVSHVETFYMEIKPEEAVKVTVTDSTETPRNEDSDSSDENRTLHDDLHSGLLEDNQSSTSATLVDGTVKIVVKPRSNSYITGSSHSEDTSMGLSMSEWSSSNNTVRQFCQYSGTKSDDNSLAELGASISDWSGSTTVIPGQQYYTAIAAEKSQSDTTTSEKSVTSMRPNSKCQNVNLSASREDLTNLGFDDDDTGYPDDGEEGEGDDDQRNDEFNEARKFVESQFDEHRKRYDDDQSTNAYTDISPPQIVFHRDYDDEEEEGVDEDLEFGALPSIPVPILEEEEEDEDQHLYDNVPVRNIGRSRMKISPADSMSEDTQDRYSGLASRSRSGDDEWSFEEPRVEMSLDEDRSSRALKEAAHKFNRGYSDPVPLDNRRGTRSTQRPVIFPNRAKSTPYYSTTSLSGESTTSSPPMPVRTQIRTKTMAAYAACRSPQSEGDTSSSMDSPAHTPDRGQRAFRRKRQLNAKRRHRVSMDLEIKDGHVVSSTDSSFDVANIPPPLLIEEQEDVNPDEEEEDMMETLGHEQ